MPTHSSERQPRNTNAQAVSFQFFDSRRRGSFLGLHASPKHPSTPPQLHVRCMSTTIATECRNLLTTISFFRLHNPLLFFFRRENMNIIFQEFAFNRELERSFLKSPGSSSRHHTHQPIKPQRNELSVVRLAAGGTAWTHEVRDCRKDAPKLGLLWRANEKACDEARAPIRQRRLKFPQGCTKAPVRNRSAHHRGVRKEYLPHLIRTKNDLAKLNESDTGKVHSRFAGLKNRQNCGAEHRRAKSISLKISGKFADIPSLKSCNKLILEHGPSIAIVITFRSRSGRSR